MDTEWSDILLLNFLHTATELMENLKEREQLLSLLCHTINGFTDDLDGEKTTQMTGETVSKLCKSKKLLDSQNSEPYHDATEVRQFAHSLVS